MKEPKLRQVRYRTSTVAIGNRMKSSGRADGKAPPSTAKRFATHMQKTKVESAVRTHFIQGRVSFRLRKATAKENRIGSPRIRPVGSRKARSNDRKLPPSQ